MNLHSSFNWHRVFTAVAAMAFLFGFVPCVLAQTPTSTAISVSAATVTYGTTQTFTATVTAGTSAVTAGTVTFTDNTTPSSTFTTTGLLSASGQATATARLRAGSHVVQATYVPDGSHMGSSNTTTVTVNKAILTVTADSIRVTQGSTFPPLTWTYSGFVNNDTATSALTGSPSLSTSAGPDSDPDSYLIVVSAGTLSSQNYSFSFVNGILILDRIILPTFSLTITSGDLQSAKVNTTFLPLQVTPRDSNGLPIPGAVVTFTGPSTGPGLSAVTVTATANASGIASITPTANNLSGSYLVTVTSGAAAAVSFQLTNTGGDPAVIVATAGDAQSAHVGDLFSTSLAVTVKDAFGNLVSNATVTFRSSGSASGADVTFPSGNTAVTNASGVATLSVRANLSVGSYTITASSGTATVATFTLTNTPQPAVIVPALSSGPATQLGIAWSNPLSKTVTLTLTARGYDGQLLAGSGIQNPAQLTVFAHSQIAKQATEIFGANIAGRAGWVELSSSDRGGGGFFLLFDSILSVIDGGALIDKPVSRLLFPHVNERTILHVVNTGTQAIRPVLLQVFDNNGNVVGNTTVGFDARGGWTGRIADLIPALTTVDGYVVFDLQGTPFTNPAPILVGMASYQQGGDNAIVIAQDDSAPITNGYAVHVASGGGYASRLRLVNRDLAAQQLQLSLNGASVQRTIPANGRLDEALDQMFNLSSGTLTTGYLSFQASTSGVNGFVEIAASQGGALTAEPISGQARTEIIFSHLAQGGAYWTGLALVNPDFTAATVTIEINAPDGTTVASKVITLDARQRTIGLVNELFPTLQNQVGGYVHITSTRGIHALQI